MKKSLAILVLVTLLYPSCTECVKKELDNPFTIQMTGKITVFDGVSNPVEGADVGFQLQKFFCDGDYGLPVPIFGKTNAQGEFDLTWLGENYFAYSIGNEDEKIVVNYVLGTTNNEIDELIVPYDYSALSNSTGVINLRHTFFTN